MFSFQSSQVAHLCDAAALQEVHLQEQGKADKFDWYGYADLRRSFQKVIECRDTSSRQDGIGLVFAWHISPLSILAPHVLWLDQLPISRLIY